MTRAMKNVSQKVFSSKIRITGPKNKRLSTLLLNLLQMRNSENNDLV